MTKVAVLGGGNGAHAMAADLSLRGFEVHMCEDPRFAGKMQKVFDTKEIKLVGAIGNETVPIAMVTTDLEAAIADVKYIIVAVPAFAHKTYAEKLAPIIRPGQIVFVTPGTFGSLIFWKAFKEAGKTGDVVVAETSTLPYAARMSGEGEITVMNRFNPLGVGVMPASRTDEIVPQLSQFFPGLQPKESVVACGLTSMNPHLHVPAVVMNAGRIEYAKGEFYCYKEGFTPCVARATQLVDNERIAMMEKLGYQWNLLAYDVRQDIQTDDLMVAVAQHPSITKIKGPSDLKNRYFTEDIPFGLAIWAKLAKHIGVPTPMMDSMIYIGSAIIEKDCWTLGHSLQDLGIDQMDVSRLKTYLETGK